MPSAADPVGPAADSRQATFAAQTVVAVLLMFAMFAAPDVADLWSATISRLLIVAAGLTLSLALLLLGQRARERSAVIAVTPCVSGAVLLLVEV